ncbi:CLC_0170 family protein [Hathewaya massiliensis]|uniref:CLC_0170 family protein n=1 Tax=Hathewaya massiliensis TaxID=1964382 RepID=UPI00115BDE6A|nr:CLC_0170 family protein [Hathewaya massiliensis]
MRYFELFDIHFLILNLVNSCILIQVDGKQFKKSKDSTREKRAKKLGYLLIIASFILFIIRSFI